MLAIENKSVTIAHMQEKYTAEDAYSLHVEQIEGEGSTPTTPFLELSDMAIQMYEIEADLLNQTSSTSSPETAS